MRVSWTENLTAAVLIVVLGLPGIVFAGDEPDRAELAAELRAAEEAFARTMADRDLQAFGTFLADEAVFFGTNGEIRGKTAVVEAWRPFFDSPTAPFSWRPTSATVLESGGLGLTSGPVLGPDRRQLGTFNTVWRRDPDGTWRVVFDRGCPECECPP